MTDKTYDYLFKLLLIGDSDVGKPQILLRFSDDAFNNTFISTVGIDFRNRTIELMGKKIKLQTWDTAGQERYKAITTAYYRDAMGLMLVYDITQKKSFESIEKWIQNVKEHDKEDTKIILVGNKCDLEYRRQVSTESARKLAASYGINFMEVSAKKDFNIQKAFLTLAADILAGINEVVPKSVSSSEDLEGSAGVPGKERNSFRSLLTSFFRGKPHNPSSFFSLSVINTAIRSNVELVFLDTTTPGYSNI